jgi:ribulose-bisphosphate carboxylase small chain
MPFKSTVGDYQTVATLETFGFLPPMTQDEIYDQIAYIIAQGWSPLIEHVHPSRSMATYWSYWKLPFFGEKDLSVIVNELEACHRAYPEQQHRNHAVPARTGTATSYSLVNSFDGRTWPAPQAGKQHLSAVVRSPMLARKQPAASRPGPAGCARPAMPAPAAPPPRPPQPRGPR